MSFEGTHSEVLTFADILIRLEESYGIQITDAEAIEITTLQDLVQIINQKYYGEEKQYGEGI
jgi:acyl carrier protein